MGLFLWKVAGASVVGFSHVEAGTPCQDAHATAILPNGWFVGVVSDGAGSAARSAEGSRSLCDGVVAFVCSRLTKVTEANESCLSEPLVREWVEEAVEQSRERFRELTNNAPGGIAVFHATLVGVVAGPSGGVFFHVGDGAGLATCFNDLSASVVSPPENGEFANDTYFVTQDQWQQHLRTTPFGAGFDLIALMSDGVMPFALARGAKTPSAPFFEPLSRYLADHERNESENELAALLQRDAIRRITGDDKTLIWALRGGG